MSFRDFALDEANKQPIGGQLSSFEAVFSPRAEDGRPMPLFDRETGLIDPLVARAWRKYDIGAILRERWDALAPKLAGKLHVWCGTLDTFHFESAVRLLKDDLTRFGSNADILLVEGRNHGDLITPHPDLWPNGMKARIHAEMAARAETLVRP